MPIGWGWCTSVVVYAPLSALVVVVEMQIGVAWLWSVQDGMGFAPEAAIGTVKADVLRLGYKVLAQLLEDIALGPFCFDLGSRVVGDLLEVLELLIFSNHRIGALRSQCATHS